MTLYEITEENRVINELLDNAVDENGEPRELTEDEKRTISEWFAKNETDLRAKADAYGKFIVNLKIAAENAKSEKDNFKAELDRLAKRAKVFESRKEALTENLFYAMNFVSVDKIKTDLFSFTIQNKPMSINIDNAVVSNIPDQFLKKEISKSAIQLAIKNGEITITDSGYLILASTGELLEGIKVEKNKHLVIR